MARGGGASEDGLAFSRVWKIRISAVLWFVLALGCLVALPVLAQASPFLILAIALLALLLAALFTLVRHVLFRGRTGGFLAGWLKASLCLFFVLSMGAAMPVYYMAIRTALDPPLLPRAVLTDGRKTVVYQGMMHVGTEQFYKQVVYDLEQALADGYVLYYEGVQPDPRGDAWFSRTLAGGGDLSANYRALGKMCGLKFQSDYFSLLEADRREHPDRHVIADVDTWEMQQEYDRLLREDPQFAAGIEEELAERASASDEPSGKPMAFLDGLTDGQLRLMGYYCRDQASNVVRGAKKPAQINKVIVDFRNRKLADRILADPHDRIYVTYGADHLTGVLPLLRKADPHWHVETVSWSTPVEAPRSLSSEL